MTTEQIDNLKRCWKLNPCWDIEDTEGFGFHKAELLVYRLETEKQWALNRALAAESALRSFAQALKPYLQETV